MRSKTLIAVAVASTFGWAAAAHAGPEHHAGSMADQASYPSSVMFDSDGMGTIDSSASAALADGTYSEYYLVSWSPSSASQWDNFVMLEPSTSDMLVLLDDGASTVSMSEVMGSSPDAIVLMDEGYLVVPIYELPAGTDTMVLIDDERYLISTYDVILLPSDFM